MPVLREHERAEWPGDGASTRLRCRQQGYGRLSARRLGYRKSDVERWLISREQSLEVTSEGYSTAVLPSNAIGSEALGYTGERPMKVTPEGYPTAVIPNDANSRPGPRSSQTKGGWRE
jgi:hypothetical protein